MEAETTEQDPHDVMRRCMVLMFTVAIFCSRNKQDSVAWLPG